MNHILQLKGRFNQRQEKGRRGPRNLPVTGVVTSAHMKALADALQAVETYWKSQSLVEGALVSVHYTRVIAKSHRLQALLRGRSFDPDDAIRGAKFSDEGGRLHHVFTYFVDLSAIRSSSGLLLHAAAIIDQYYAGKIDHAAIEKIKGNFFHKGLSRTRFIDAVVDSFYVSSFGVDFTQIDESKDAVVTLYRTNLSTKEIFRKIGINDLFVRYISENTVLLTAEQFALLKERVPSLIAMQVRDLREIPKETAVTSSVMTMQIPEPGQEPVIGVIDTPCSKDVYFAKWVDCVNMIDENIELRAEDYDHGTKVSSIIVDGPSINPLLDDGCGRFRVRHFGVAVNGRFSSYSLIKKIRQIVSQNRDIKVWNISLGSCMEVSRNFISPEAAELDRIQKEYDVIFVVAGTNRTSDFEGKQQKIGAPADSLNAVVVNSVTRNGRPASYSRVGPVLEFFHKPDISYFGGDGGEEIHTCAPTGEAPGVGTSFAAPWIARKLAYLIQIMGFSREVAKALLIDSAAGWKYKRDDWERVNIMGYGVVPQRIEEIVETPDDEIRFVLTGSCDAYETYTYDIPVPVSNEKQPFWARATLCYFPLCEREQGVDYTCTEMDIHFGRVIDKKGKVSIGSINANTQGDPAGEKLYEKEARGIYRKWDNVKIISDVITKQKRPRKIYAANGVWGLSIKTKERLKEKNGKGLRFGVVITLKEMNGENRIDEFIKRCALYGWIVNPIEIQNRIDVYQQANEKIFFE